VRFVGLILGAIVPWHVALLGAWNALALTFLGSVAPIILRSDSATTEHLACARTSTATSPARCC
jgi:hypothetical protein